MTITKKNELMTLAKGHIQRQLLYDLLNNKKTAEFRAYMKSPSYSNSYTNSFLNLIARLRHAGLSVQIKKGKLGGLWSAYAYIT